MDPRLETPRLVLRPWSEQDVEQLTLGLNDLNVARWLAFVPHPYLTSHAKEWIARCMKSAARPHPIAYEFAVELKSKRCVIGGVSLNKIDWTLGSAGGGLWLASEFHRHGYGREAFAEKIRFAFRDLRLTKLVNGFLDGNEASWQMQRRLGYRLTAQAGRRCMADGRLTVEHVTTLLRSDWDKRA